MKRRIFYAKLHRAVITQANLDYEGSLTIDADLLAAADILEHEEVHVWNVTRGSRLTTYAIGGPPGSGVICINGAAAHLNKPGDLVIIATYAEMSREEALVHVPRVVRLDENNRIVSMAPENPGPGLPLHLAGKQ